MVRQVTSRPIKSPYIYVRAFIYCSYKQYRGMHRMEIRAGEILKSHEGHYYRVLEASQLSISLMRVNGQTIFACRPQYVALNFFVPSTT